MNGSITVADNESDTGHLSQAFLDVTVSQDPSTTTSSHSSERSTVYYNSIGTTGSRRRVSSEESDSLNEEPEREEDCAIGRKYSFLESSMGSPSPTGRLKTSQSITNGDSNQSPSSCSSEYLHHEDMMGNYSVRLRVKRPSQPRANEKFSGRRGSSAVLLVEDVVE